MNTSNQLLLPVYQGNAITTQVTFSNPQPNVASNQWTPVDPSTVTVTFVVGNGTPTVWTYGATGSIVRSSTGVYLAELDTTNKPGRWQVKWVGTGACAAVSVQGFQVTPQPF
jgi:hypothetical protein